MCKTPKAPKVEIPDPVILRNPFLDADRSKNSLISSLRTGRTALRIPLGSGINPLFSARNAGGSASGTAGARGNARPGLGGTSGFRAGSSGSPTGGAGGGGGRSVPNRHLR